MKLIVVVDMTAVLLRTWLCPLSRSKRFVSSVPWNRIGRWPPTTTIIHTVLRAESKMTMCHLPRPRDVDVIAGQSTMLMMMMTLYLFLQTNVSDILQDLRTLCVKLHLRDRRTKRHVSLSLFPRCFVRRVGGEARCFIEIYGGIKIWAQPINAQNLVVVYEENH